MNVCAEFHREGDQEYRRITLLQFGGSWERFRPYTTIRFLKKSLIGLVRYPWRICFYYKLKSI